MGEEEERGEERRRLERVNTGGRKEECCGSGVRRSEGWRSAVGDSDGCDGTERVRVRVLCVFLFCGFFAGFGE
jgi:hypothetical protein